jgi:HD superfamily phosphohydrolase
MDRLDYLNRDSFYTGVLEGTIGAQRIIKMLELRGDELVIEEKGIYSIEKFIIARRLMYWQVYLHKTVLGAEHLLIKIIQRAKELVKKGMQLFASPPLAFFLKNDISEDLLLGDAKLLELFAKLDDYDIYNAIKVWADSDDIVLSRLCSGMVNRKLYKIRIRKEPFTAKEISLISSRAEQVFGISAEDASYFAFAGTISNSAYDPRDEQIRILYKDGTVKELMEVSDQMDVAILSRPVQKSFLCFLEELA